MEQLGNLLLAIYRAARETPLVEFQDAALHLIKPVLRFDASMWGSGTWTSQGVGVHHLHLHNKPPEMIHVYEEAKHEDHAAAAAVKAAVTTRKSVVVNFNTGALFSGREKRAIRAYARRFKLENTLIAGDASGKEDLLRWVTLYRADSDEQYTEEERRLCGYLFPHLLEALAINRVAHFEELDKGAGAKVHFLAIADRRGVLYQADTGFVRLLREEFPAVEGSSLSERLVSTLFREGRYIGRAAAFTARVADELLFLKARLRVPADSLSPRELAVAREIRRGATYKEIARRLHISPVTVRNHIQAIHERLQVRNNAEVAVQLQMAGL